jgi:bifunctional DNase/RNase
MLKDAKHFDIELVIISEANDSHPIYLREVAGDQSIPILTGVFEATALHRALKRLPSPRPLTHDAMAMIIRALGAEVQDVLIDKLDQHIYHAKVRIRHGANSTVVDIRPSDAFMLAIAFDRPIFFAEGVLEQLR